jgi:hypothetical protein
MSSNVRNSQLKQARSQALKPLASAEMLTPAEIRALRRDKKNVDAYAKKAFAALANKSARTKPD